MPAIAYTVDSGLGWRSYTWTGVTEADTFVAAEVGGQTDRSVQATGTFGSATLLVKGSNDGTTYLTLTDPQGNAISKTADALEQIEEGTRYIQPTHSGGTGETIKVIIFVVRKP